MITKENFIEIISSCKDQRDNLNELEALGFEIWKTSVVDFGFIMFDNVINTNFNDEGAEWINWWFLERDNEWFSEIGKAWDKNGKEVPIETIEDLWNIVEKYRI